MENRPRVLEMYVRKDGRTPYEDWFLGLVDKAVKVKVINRLDQLSLGGFGKHRVLDGGLAELKIDHGPGFRIYIGLAGPVLVILLCGGDKRTQDRDIELARIYWADYRRRRKKAT